MTLFDKAFAEVQLLVQKFTANYNHYMSSTYSEAEARQDFIDPFFTALGWDVHHHYQTNPYEQEVKIERSQKQQNETARKRADYAFFTAPNFKDEVFFCEAKKPSVLIENNAQHYFQTQRYGWNAGCPISVLTDFEELVIIDCRQKPNIKFALNGRHKSFKYTDYTNTEIFAQLYWLFSHEAVTKNSIAKYAETLPKPKGKTEQKKLFKGGYQAIDESFLIEIDAIRENIAKAFKKTNDQLNSEQLTEATQRTVDRLVFIRFLEDKFIEADDHVSEWTSWNDFISDCRKLDAKYNGVVFKKHFIDEPHFIGADESLFLDICSDISNTNSPYDFNYIPIHILGSIYERFLGKVVIATDKRVRIEEKPEVRKAGGVYYTPKYIVDYIVQNTVGKIIDGLTPAQIAGKAPINKKAAAPSPLERAGGEVPLSFADIACGSGSFLIGVYDCLLDYHKKYYAEKLADKTELDKRNEDYNNVEYIDKQWRLTLKLKQDILLNNIYGVDIDAQAVEVTQLSLFLKMLEDENVQSTTAKQGSMFSKVLPDLSKNIVCGNSLIGWDIMQGQLFENDALKKLNPMDYDAVFPKIMRSGGFDAVVGNPPYLSTKRGFAENAVENKYLKQKFITASKQFDSYTIFIEQANNVMNENGFWGYIIPKPFLSNENMLTARTFLLEKGTVINIADFGTPFKDASVEAVSIIHTKKSFPNTLIEIFKNEILEKQTCINQNIFFDNPHNAFTLVSNSRATEVLKQIEKVEFNLLSFVKDFKRGIEAGKKDASIRNEFKANYKKLLRGLDVSKYSISYVDIFIEVDKKDKNKFKDASLYEVEKKILIRRVGSDLQATIDVENYWNLNTIYNLILKDESFYEFIVAILNSKLISFWFKNRFVFEDKLFPYARISQLEQIPIPKLDLKDKIQKQQHDNLVNFVTQMLATKKQLSIAITDSDKNFLQNKCNSIDKQIDNLVYALYGLSEEEIKIVEEG